MKPQEVLRSSNFEEVLNSLPGDYEKIREFRSKLDESVRELFDVIFLIGFREGLLLNLVPRYVRLGPSTLFRVPECYGHYGVMIECNLCSVKAKCKQGVELEDK